MDFSMFRNSRINVPVYIKRGVRRIARRYVSWNYWACAFSRCLEMLDEPLLCHVSIHEASVRVFRSRATPNHRMTTKEMRY